MSDASNSSGFTLVEIMVAMVVLAIGLLGMAAMTVMVMRGNKSSSNLTSATNICQEKIEELKDISWDNVGNWIDGVSPANVEDWGAPNAELVQEKSLNGNGKTSDEVCQDLKDQGTACTSVSDCDDWDTDADTACRDEIKAQGPYNIDRTFVICKGEDYTTGPLAPPSGSDDYTAPSNMERATAKDCSIYPPYEATIDTIRYGDDATRTEGVACFDTDIQGSGTSKDNQKKIKVLCSWLDRSGTCHSIKLDTTVVKLSE